MIADTIGRLLAAENGFGARRERLAASPPGRLALWRQLAETGMIGSGFPEEAGGFGGSPRDVAVVQYALGRSLAVEPYLGVVLGARLLLAAAPGMATGEIERIIAGDRILILAHGEGFDPFAPSRLVAAAEGSGYRLTGVKQVVRHADVAHAFIVTAGLPDGRQGCFLVERTGDGVHVDPFRLIDASGGGTLLLDGAPASLLLAGEEAQAAIAEALDWGLLGLAAEAVGILDALNEATREYLRTRVQFGVPIGNFQALQHRSADMFIAGEEAGVATDAVLTAFSQDIPGPQRSARASALKAIIDRAGLRIGHEAVQMHGGIGVSDELIISHYLRRLAAIRAELGGADVHRERYRSLAARKEQ